MTPAARSAARWPIMCMTAKGCGQARCCQQTTIVNRRLDHACWNAPSESRAWFGDAASGEQALCRQIADNASASSYISNDISISQGHGVWRFKPSEATADGQQNVKKSAPVNRQQRPAGHLQHEIPSIGAFGTWVGRRFVRTLAPKDAATQCSIVAKPCCVSQSQLVRASRRANPSAGCFIRVVTFTCGSFCSRAPLSCSVGP